MLERNHMEHKNRETEPESEFKEMVYTKIQIIINTPYIESKVSLTYSIVLE